MSLVSEAEKLPGLVLTNFLAEYFSCQVSGCRCCGWRSLKKPKFRTIQKELCIDCKHDFTDHVINFMYFDDGTKTQLRTVLKELDVIHRVVAGPEDCNNYRQIHVYLDLFLMTLFRCPELSDTFPLESFESSSIATEFQKFVELRFNNELEFYTELVAFICERLNCLQLDDPIGTSGTSGQTVDVRYNVWYLRWLCHCQIPTYCALFERSKASEIFGLIFLRKVFDKLCADVTANVTQLDNDYLPKIQLFLDAFRTERIDRKGSSTQMKRAFTAVRMAQDFELSVQNEVVCSSVAAMPAHADCGVTKQAKESASSSVAAMPAQADCCVTKQAKESALDKNLTFKIFEGPNKERLLALDNVGGELEQIFVAQLPNITKSFIKQQMYQAQHTSIALLRGHTVVGGACFRIFHFKGFSELMFFAVKTDEQVKGYGTRLMHYLRRYLSKKSIFDILTYADHHAIAFFTKQGFSTKIGLPAEKYKDEIRVYDHATLMHYEDVCEPLTMSRKRKSGQSSSH